MTIRICGDVEMEYKLEELFDLQMVETEKKNSRKRANVRDKRFLLD